MSDHHPSPQLLFETVSAYQRSQALHTAVELDLFTAISASGKVSEIARSCGASERGIRILCDFLTVDGFLTKTGGDYGLTQDSAVFLVSTSRTYLGGTLRFLHSGEIMKAFEGLTEAVRKGGTALPHEGTTGEADPVWVDFAIGMMPMMMPTAQGLAAILPLDGSRPLRVLDIAAGHGVYGITVAQKYPQAQVVALDWPDVVAVAASNAARMGVGDRHTTIAGSAFDVDFGGKYDLILLTNFLHHFDPPTNEKLLRKVHAALNPGGAAATVEFVPNTDRVTPPMPATFALTMLATTPHGDAYTFAELDVMFRNAGFAESRFEPIPHSMNSLVWSPAE